MNLFKTILVPVDFSEPSRKALDCGIGLAVRLKAKLVIAHIVPESLLLDSLPLESALLETKHREKALLDIQALLPEPLVKQLDLQIIVKTGRVEEDLLAIVNEHSVDVVVMGSHGRRLFRRWFLGSVAEHLLRRVPVPILTMSHMGEDRHPFGGGVLSFQRVLLATDLGESFDIGMKYAAELAKSFSGQLTVLTVVEYLNLSYEAASYLDEERATRRADAQKELDAFVIREKTSGMNVKTVVADGKAYEQILTAAEQVHADCIVLTLQSRSLLERAFLGSTAERVVRLAPIPVLSIPFAASGH